MDKVVTEVKVGDVLHWNGIGLSRINYEILQIVQPLHNGWIGLTLKNVSPESPDFGKTYSNHPTYLSHITIVKPRKKKVFK